MRVVFKHLGYLLLIFSLFPLLPLVHSIVRGEPFFPFIVPILISLGLGILILSSKQIGPDITVSDLDIPRSIALSALTFVVISILGAIPFIMMSGFAPLDAVFESFSGFTTTGLTIIDNVEIQPHSLLLWRAETQWIGGLGIVILFLIIISAMRRQDSLKKTTTKARAIATLYQAQGAAEKVEANTRKSIRNTVILYFTYTLVGILLLWIVGLSAFESVSIAFTAISTAGFSVTNVFYTAWPVLIVVSLLILAGAVSFVVHNRLFKREFLEVFRNRVFLFYMGFISTAVLIMFLCTNDFKVALFQTLTAFTTTGYSITDVALMPHIAIFIIMMGMVVGGMIGSTCGGIKINRLLLTLKSIRWMVRKNTAPRGAIIPLKMNGKPVEEGSIAVMYAYISCYILILIAGSLVLMFTGLSFLDSSFHMFSALGGVGLATAKISAFNALAKILLIIAMLFGRLEIFPVLVLGKMILDSAKRAKRRQREESRKHFYMRWIPAGLWKKQKIQEASIPKKKS